MAPMRKSARNRQAVAWVGTGASRLSSQLASTAQLRPPPGLLPEPRLPHFSPPDTNAEDFVKAMRARALPPQLESDNECQKTFNDSIFCCVVSLYSDRIEPTLSEIQKRLRSSGWGFSEVQSVLPMCARSDDIYELLPPGCDLESLVLLRQSPPWFKGWVDAGEPKDTFSDSVWNALEMALSELDHTKSEFSFSGGCCDLASIVKEKAQTYKLAELSLGEIRNLLRLAFGPQRRLLAYDAFHGGRLTKANKSCRAFSPPVQPKSSNGCNVSGRSSANSRVDKATHVKMSSGEKRSVETLLCAMLQKWPLLECLDADRYDSKACCSRHTLQKCVDDLYRQRVKPTLCEVQQALLKAGWTFNEVQGVLPLCSRDPYYQVQIPMDGNEILILRSEPPSWFQGWGFREVLGEAHSCISPDVWDVLWCLLQLLCPELSCSIGSRLHDLRKKLFLAPLTEMSLAELCDIVSCACC